MRQYVITTVILLAGATAVQAQGLPGIPTGIVLTEVMMDVQSSEAQLYGAMLGVNPTSPQTLSGTTSTDVSSASFSFSLNAGSTYLGQPISDSVSGSYNPTDSAYEWNGAGAWAGNNWTWGGSITFDLINVTGPVWGLNSIGSVQTLLFNPLFNELDRDILNGTSPTSSLWRFILYDQNGNILGSSTGSDSFDPTTGRYSFQDQFLPAPGAGFPGFSEVMSGISPEAGGAGTFTLTIGAVPEPSSWVMGLLGVMGVLGYVWWARKTPGA